MGSEIELVSDGDGLAVIGNSTDVERFLLSAGLDEAPSKELDLHRLWSSSGTAGVAAQMGVDFAENSGRWVKLTAESAKAVEKYGLMPITGERSGVWHAMIGNPGHIKQWIQIEKAPALLGGPFALAAVATMMQQRAMQQQMDEIVEYLQEISEKVDDILRGQKDAVLADMIGVDLIVEEALAVRDQVGRVSEVTWSKVQGASMTIGRTQAYALPQLDDISEKLKKKADVGEIAKATRDAEPKVREWLAVLARTFQLQDGVSVLELDRVLDASPDELDSHRLGLTTARQNRLELIRRSTTRLLTQMDETVRKANSKVLFNPFDSPAAVKSSNQVAIDVLGFRDRLGIESGRDSSDAKRWRQAAGEVVDHATERFRSVDRDGDGISDQPLAREAAEQAGAAIRDAAAGVAGAFGTLFQRKRENTSPSRQTKAEPTDDAN